MTATTTTTARTKRTDSQAREHVVGVRLNAQERANLLAMANAERLPVAVIVRRLIRAAVQERRRKVIKLRERR